MKLRYYVHASFQILTDSGFRLLSDPWRYNPVSNTIWQFPECPIPLETYVDQDALYLSHSHADHFCPDTLEHFRRDIPIIIRRYDERDNPLEPVLRKMGFTTLIELEHGASSAIAPGVRATLYADENTYDSALVVEADNQAIFHQNDCMLDPRIASQIGCRHRLDIALLGLVNSSIYPTFFEMDPASKQIETEKRRKKVLTRTADYAQRLNPDYVIPNASDMVYIRFPETDEFLGPHPNDLVRHFSEINLRPRAVTLSPGDVFDPAAPRTDYQPAFSDHQDLLRKLSALRAEPEVRAALARLEAWESGFTFDESLFQTRLSAYTHWVSQNWREVFADRFNSMDRPSFAVDIVLAEPDMPTCRYRVIVDYEACTMTFGPEPAVASPPDMRLTGWHRYFEMFRQGVLTFDDVRSGWLSIWRPGPFTKAEVGFWHLMMAFTSFNNQTDAVQPITDRAFRGRIARFLDA